MKRTKTTLSKRTYSMDPSEQRRGPDRAKGRARCVQRGTTGFLSWHMLGTSADDVGNLRVFSRKSFGSTRRETQP